MLSAAEILQLEEDRDRLQDEVHVITTKLKASEGNTARLKLTIATLETKLKRAQDSERAALERVAELETSGPSFAAGGGPSGGSSTAAVGGGGANDDHLLWEMTAQCVVASYKQRLLDEREHAEALSSILHTAHSRLAMRIVSSVGGSSPAAASSAGGAGSAHNAALVLQLQEQNQRLQAKLLDMTALSDTSASMRHLSVKTEAVQLGADLEEARRENAQLREALRKQRAKYRLLQDELATVYRHGIQTKEALLQDFTAHQDPAVARLTRRVAELDQALSSRTQALAVAERQLQQTNNASALGYGGGAHSQNMGGQRRSAGSVPAVHRSHSAASSTVPRHVASSSVRR